MKKLENSPSRPRNHFLHVAPRAMFENVPGDEAKQDRLRRRRERDRLRRERETPEEKDARFVNLFCAVCFN